MKKLLAFLGSISIIGVSAISTTACASKQSDASLETIKQELEQYVERPFLASSSIITSEKLVEELENRLTLANYKLAIKNDETFVQPKIAGDNVQPNTSANAEQEEAKGDLEITNGTATVSVFKKDKEELNIKIQWIGNELLHLKNAVKNINNTSNKKQKIDLPFPQIKPGIYLTFAELYSFLVVLELPTDEIMQIDLTKIAEPDFIAKFDNVLEIIANNAKGGGIDINSFLDKDISFNESGIKGKGTIRDLVHNIAPDLIALLQWFIKDGKAEIEKTHNTVLPLVQYLLSPVNSNLKANIGATFGESKYFYQNTGTNLDVLVFHLLVGYKANYENTESKYRMSILISEISQGTVGTLLGLKPTLLIASILDTFISAENKSEIDAVNTNILQPSKWKGINSFLTNLIPEINVFLGPSLITYAGSNILSDLGASNADLKNNNFTMSSGWVTLQFKNKMGDWENFTAIIGENNSMNLKQILNAVDFKLSFTDVKFKVTSKVNDKITYETNGKSLFDICFSQ